MVAELNRQGMWGGDRPRRGSPITPAILTSLVLAASIAGCDQGPGRLALTGSVELDGQPLPKGYVIFEPEPGSPGPNAAADIVDGTFSVPAAKGVSPGTFRVQIEALRPSGRKQRNPRTNQLVEVQEQFIPARYNTESTLTANVEAGTSNRFEFSLDSQ